MKVVLAAALLFAVTGCGDGASAPLRTDGAGAVPLEVRCAAGDQLRVTVFVDAPGDAMFGFHTVVRYPSELSIPGRRDDPSVADRVEFILDFPRGTGEEPVGTPVTGVTVVNDHDADFDGVDDQIHTLLSSPFTAFPDGKFVEITFDCVDAVARPGVDLVTCEVWGATDDNLMEAAQASSCTVLVTESSG